MTTTVDNIGTYELLRLGQIKRWSIINTTNAQTVADHSFQVMVIGMRLFELTGEADHRGGPGAHELMCALLFHDATEAVYGDIPTPCKRFIRAYAGDGVFDTMDAAALPIVPYLQKACPAWTGIYVKVSDSIEAAHWLEQNYSGVHADKVRLERWRYVVNMVADLGPNWETAVDALFNEMGVSVEGVAC